MKAKELSAFLRKYALEKPTEDPSASSKRGATDVPEAEAEDSEDAKGKAVPQVGNQLPAQPCASPCWLYQQLQSLTAGCDGQSCSCTFLALCMCMRSLNRCMLLLQM